MQPAVTFASDVPFATLTTLEIGGPARWFAQVETVPELQEALRDSRRDGTGVMVVGEGSNLVVSDAGFPGLVLRLGLRALEVQQFDDPFVDVRVEAGMVWDRLVALCVAEGWAGVECLSGIPGLVGAAPIQNIGAYGQEVAETVTRVDVVERASGQEHSFSAAECGFGYRQSRFKQDWKDRYVVTAVHFRLRQGGLGKPKYRDLVTRLGNQECPLATVRDTVLAVRAEKSMLRNPSDPNSRSAGSFFMNPVVPEDVLAGQDMPRYPAGPGQVKLSAAWLIENSGFPKGYGEGTVGLSSRHVLALVNRGGATASDLLALARTVRRGVQATFGVELWPEPEFVGFDRPLGALLEDA